MRLALGLATLALVTLGLGSAARADTFALLAPSGPANLTAATRASAIDTLAAALRASSHRPTLPVEVARQLAEAHSPTCATLDCAQSVLTTLHVDAVIETVLWPDERGGVREVVVSIARANGTETSGTATVDHDGLATTVRAALAQALSATSHAVSTTHLVVSASPRGAALTLDGRPLGQAPWEGVLPTGHHVLVAGYVGFLIERRELELGAESVELTLNLVRDPDAEVTTTTSELGGGAASTTATHPGRAHPGVHNRAILGPIVLGVLGVGLVTLDAVALVPRRDTGLRQPTLQVPPFIAYGVLGIGALTAGLLWFLLSGDDRTPAATATLDLQPDSITGAVHFCF